ncbi:MAG TPA: M23 family metallopeptidase [Vicinamibacterales bacterium]|nr:M23 family metallopeptidase [Vicinamibacterales bacterium]
MSYTRRFVSRRDVRPGLTVLIVAAAACTVPAPPASRSATPPQDVLLARDVDAVEGRVPHNATLETILRQHQYSAELTAALVDAMRGVFNPRELRAEQAYRLTRSLDGLFREFRYQIDTDRLLRVVSRGPSAGDAAGDSPATGAVPRFDVEVVSLPKETELDTLSASISRETPSLVGALDASGETVQLALGLAEIFGGEIDFNSDLQPGDRIDVLFERYKRDGEFIGYGAIKAAVLFNEDRKVTAVGFPDADDHPAWYDEDGRSLRRQFLQSPLPFDPRVTSRFSYRRLHPVHGTTRAHLGVDYGAPAGTRVNAVASGVVELAGWAGEGGRVVRLRHAGGYQTAYLHLSAIAPGIRPGARVEQGTAIGRVGSTGTATGPHLDYRIIKNGTYVNPLVELKKMPKGDPIAPDAREAFLRERDAVLARLPGGTR